MRIEYAASAYKHGIREEQIRHVVERWGPPFSEASDILGGDDASLYIGEDAKGRPLEIMGIECEEEAPDDWYLYVYHAMELRRLYWPYYEEKIRWRSVGLETGEW